MLITSNQVETVVQAIYRTEGSSHTTHPYGIMQTYKHTTPHDACWNTIDHFIRRHKIVKIDKAFIYLLADQYCPPQDDPIGNKNWKYNMVMILNLQQ